MRIHKTLRHLNDNLNHSTKLCHWRRTFFFGTKFVHLSQTLLFQEKNVFAKTEKEKRSYFVIVAKGPVRAVYSFVLLKLAFDFILFDILL